MNAKIKKIIRTLKKSTVLLLVLIMTVCTIGSGSVFAASAGKNRTSAKKNYVTLCTQDGREWKKIIMDGARRFPSVATEDGTMFLGWSASKGHSKHPKYYAGDWMPRKNATYYMVVYRKSQNTAPGSIKKSTSYKKIWFAGDSRTYGMELALGKKKPSNVNFVDKCGAGLKWFKSIGYPKLLKQVKKAPVSARKAVIINLGVNDLRDYSGYVQYMKQVSETLQSYGCDMYYMSINPVNSALIKNHQGNNRSEKQLNSINSMIYTKLCSGSDRYYKYLNTYDFLRSKGWISNAKNDGVHYSDETYKKIYDYCIRHIG